LKKIIGYIPVRLNSKRLYQKALSMIDGLPLFVHVYRRAKLSRRLNDLILCCDDNKIISIAKKYNVKCILTSKKHKNGTERIYEAYKKNKKSAKLIVDIQGDEPLINPKHIDMVIQFHLNNYKTDIILPTLKVKEKNNKNIIKVVTNLKNEVLYLSRRDVPFVYDKPKNSFFNKHLSIISFLPSALKKFASTEKTFLEKIENIELIRALEQSLKIKTLKLNGDSFSVDVKKDLIAARKKIKNDKLRKKY